MKKTQTKNSISGIRYLQLLLTLLPAAINAQSVLNASGGSHMFSGGIYEYSIGEMTAISTESGNDIIITQGLLQVEDVSLGVTEESILIEGLSIYPNPTKGELFVLPCLGKPGKLSLKLFDLLGRLVLYRTLFLETGNEIQQLDLSLLSEATYMLQVEFLYENERAQNSYKILKFGN